MKSSGTPPRRTSSALAFALVSAAAFALSGSFAKSLFDAGWSPGAAVAVRIGGGAVVLLAPVLVILVRQWHTLRPALPRIALYGVVPIAMCQLFYFNAVSHLSVGVALLLEYLSPVLLVGLAWARTRVSPRLPTFLGAGCAIGGLVLVLDLGGAQKISVAGVLWGLAAAVCSAAFFLMSARANDTVPPVLMAGGGMAVGAALIFVLGGVGIMPLTFSTADAAFAGQRLNWLVPILGLVLVSTVFAYVAGIVATRGLGSKVASFVALFEVLFAVAWAWLLLGELPQLIQLLGGLLIVGGVILVRIDELRGPAEAEFDHASDVEALVCASGPAPVPEGSETSSSASR